jgi:hypothetical protein
LLSSVILAWFFWTIYHYSFLVTHRQPFGFDSLRDSNNSVESIVKSQTLPIPGSQPSLRKKQGHASHPKSTHPGFVDSISFTMSQESSPNLSIDEQIRMREDAVRKQIADLENLKQQKARAEATQQHVNVAAYGPTIHPVSATTAAFDDRDYQVSSTHVRHASGANSDNAWSRGSAMPRMAPELAITIPQGSQAQMSLVSIKETLTIYLDQPLLTITPCSMRGR